MNVDLTYIDKVTAEQVGITLEQVEKKIILSSHQEEHNQQSLTKEQKQEEKSSYVEIGLLLLELKNGLKFTSTMNQKERYQRLRNYYRTRITSTNRDNQEIKTK